MYDNRFFAKAVYALCLPVLAIAAIIVAIMSRFVPKKIDVGIGPEPIISHLFHKQSLQSVGYSAETFVNHLYYITNKFDIIQTNGYFSRFYLGCQCLLRYRSLYFYFHGGPFAWAGLRILEPHLYKISGIKVLVMAYGSDVQDTRFCCNYAFKHALNEDYPGNCRNVVRIQKQLERWTKHADYIISGCDWVDTTPRWDKLCLAHFSIDTDALLPKDPGFAVNNSSITILHAPNHKRIKGTQYFEAAVEELQKEGYPVQLELVQNMPNDALRERIREADIIADQLIIGWYAMFALEGMSAGKPVLCYLREDLLDLYDFAGLVDKNTIPLVNCDRHSIKRAIQALLDNRERIPEIGRASREFAIKHHSIAAIGRMFGEANRAMGIFPRVRG